jgi:hypothetical protein
MDMQGLKPSILMGKLKQHLAPGVSPDTDLFMAMFLICLPPSMREAVGAGNHKTAADTVRAADALWEAQGGHDPTVAAATTHRSRSPAPTGGKTSDKWNGNARSKSRPPSRPAFHAFQNPDNGVLQVSQLLLQQSTQVYCTLYFFGKLKCRRTFSGSAAIPAHATATAMHFPANAGLIFLTDELINDRFLVDTGATLSLIPCTSNSSPSGPLLKGADGQSIPSWEFI